MSSGKRLDGECHPFWAFDDPVTAEALWAEIHAEVPGRASKLLGRCSFSQSFGTATQSQMSQDEVGVRITCRA